MSTLVDGAREVSGFDIIGDIHGCAPALVDLLKRLGYTQNGASFHHSSRMAIFVGDIIDRGPYIRAALKIVKTMVDEGQALCILGNHEVNAVIRYTEAEHEDADPRFLREDMSHPKELDPETARQFQDHPEEWLKYLRWFKTLPLFLDFDDFRVVHACWDAEAIENVRRHSVNDKTPFADALQRLALGDTELARSVDRITRGISLRYPEARYVVSKDGVKRSLFRTKFWIESPEYYGDVVFQPDPIPQDLNTRALDEAELARLSYYPDTDKPLFFGHYWLEGRPRAQRGNLACLDYGAVNFGRLTCYRFDGEKSLDDNKFVWVYLDPEEEFEL